MKYIAILFCMLWLSGCAVCFVSVKPDGQWKAYGSSLFKEINIPSVGITNSTTSIYVNGYRTTNDLAKEAIKTAIEKAF